MLDKIIQKIYSNGLVIFFFSLLRAYGIRIQSNYERNELELWNKTYPKGKVFLDIGSNYDTPYWSLKNGSEKVIAIDKAMVFFRDERIVFIRAKIDAIKIDIEGAEKGMVIETHYANPHLILLNEYPNEVRLWRLD